MRRILHLSDLHFGRVSTPLVEPLVALAHRLRPHLTVISGDLTQRARPVEFRQAADFIARLPGPVLAVPGNHDIPLDNPLLRLFVPWRGYRRFIHAELEPVFEDDEMIVAGVNTVNRWAWQQGRVGRGMVARLTGLFADAGRRTCIAVMHHPLEHRPEWDKTPMRGAVRALAPLAEAGTDIVLCGHIHRAHIAPITATPFILSVQAGTGLSDRVRGGGNSLNLIKLTGEEVGIETLSLGPDGAFTAEANTRFRRSRAGWQGNRAPS